MSPAISTICLMVDRHGLLRQGLALESVECVCPTGGATELPGRTNSIRLRAGSSDNRTARAGCSGCSADSGHCSRSLVIFSDFGSATARPPDRTQFRDELPRSGTPYSGWQIMSDTAVQTWRFSDGLHTHDDRRQSGRVSWRCRGEKSS